MSRIRRSIGWAGLLFAATALGATACAEQSLPTAAVTAARTNALEVQATRPMRMTLTVEFVKEVVPPPAPCLQLFNTALKGTGTYLGEFAGVGSTCILDAVAPDPNPPFTAPGAGPYLTATFSNPLWVLTAANGDELRLEAPDAVAVISLTDGSLRARGTHTIIGGTGRFVGATGELQTQAVNEDGLGPDDATSSGWIRF